MKRFTSLVLTLCMIFAMLPAQSGIADGLPAEETVVETPVVQESTPEESTTEPPVEKPPVVEETPAAEVTPTEEPPATVKPPVAEVTPTKEPPAEETPTEEPPAEEELTEGEELKDARDAAPRAVIYLDAPTGLESTSVTFNSVVIKWNAVTDATAYEVEYCLTSATDFTAYTTTTSRQCRVSGLVSGSEYFFRVRAIADDGTTTSRSEYSSLVRATPKPAAPSLSLTQKSSTSVQLSWGAVSGASGFYLYRSENGAAATLYRTFTDSTATAYTDTGLTTGVVYVYELCAYRTVSGQNVEGERSSPVRFRALPIAPINLVAQAASANSVKLTWNPVAGATRLIGAMGNARKRTGEERSPSTF